MATNQPSEPRIMREQTLPQTGIDAASDGTVLALGDPARLDDVLEAMG